jgi:hypothetical protein
MMETRRRRALSLRVLAGVLAALVGGVVLAQSTNSEVGTWKLNLTKSAFNSGPRLKGGASKIEAVGEGTKVIVEGGVRDDGTVAPAWEYTANYDGKDYPVTANPFGDTVARTRINATTIQSVFKKAGKVTTTQTAVISADGKTRTVTQKGMNAAGQPTDSVLVYDKQ